MQILDWKTIEMKKKYSLSMLQDIELRLEKPCIIYLSGDLGTGKTTLSQIILSQYLHVQGDITSPTYVYYNKYADNYHFDLYRIKDYDEFVSIGGEEILDNNSWIILIEWPDIIKKYYKADIEINLEKTDNEDERLIEIIYH